MILKNVGLYLLQKKYHAVWVVLLCAFLPFLRIPTFSIAAIILGLVTLHKGAKEGFFLLCWLVLPSIAAGFYDNFATFLVEGVGKGVAVWLMACILGRSTSWAVTLQAIVMCAVVLIIGFHLVVSDVSGWWIQLFTPFSDQIQTALNLNLSAAQMTLLLQRTSYFATGILALGILSLDTVLLIMARGWQALLFNPGGLSLEWRKLRLSYLYSLIVLAILVFIWLDAIWLMDILPVVLMPFIFAGLSLIHAKLPDKKNTRLIILIALYLSLLIFLPYVCAFLIVIAFLDSWFDFRSLRAKKLS